MRGRVGFVPASIVDAFVALGATHVLQDFDDCDRPTTITYFLHADGTEIGHYARIAQVGVLFPTRRTWSDWSKEQCLIVPIAEWPKHGEI